MSAHFHSSIDPHNIHNESPNEWLHEWRASSSEWNSTVHPNPTNGVLLCAYPFRCFCCCYLCWWVGGWFYSLVRLLIMIDGHVLAEIFNLIFCTEQNECHKLSANFIVLRLSNGIHFFSCFNSGPMMVALLSWLTIVCSKSETLTNGLLKVEG